MRNIFMSLFAAALLLSACSNPETTPSNSSPVAKPSTDTAASPAPSNSPATSPSPTAAPSSEPDSEEDILVSTTGVGLVRIGGPIADIEKGGWAEFVPDRCAGEPYHQTENPGRWVAAGDLQDAVSLEVDNSGNLIWIDVWSLELATTKGITRDSTRAELAAAYPDLEGPFPTDTSLVWWQADANGTLVFETQDVMWVGFESQHPAGTEVVSLLRVLPAGADPQWSSANSDFMAGGCW